MSRGFQGLQGPPGPPGSNSNILVSATIGSNTIYLNSKASNYLITFSPNILGSNLIVGSSGTPSTWNIQNILAGTMPSSGSTPTNIFPMIQVPARLFFQNQSGVPINIIFSNNPQTDITYFMFGELTNKANLTQLVQPAGVIALDVVFTSNSVIRFINLYSDNNIDYVGLSSIINNALANSYIPNQSVLTSDSSALTSAAGPTLTYQDSSSLGSSHTINIANRELQTFNNAVNVSTNNFTLTLDGSGISSSQYDAIQGAITIFIAVQAGITGTTLILSNLTNVSNSPYNVNTISLQANRSYFVTIVGGNVTVIDALSWTSIGQFIGGAADNFLPSPGDLFNKGVSTLFSFFGL